MTARVRLAKAERELAKARALYPRIGSDLDLDRLFPRSKPLRERLKGEKGWFAGFTVASRAGFR